MTCGNRRFENWNQKPGEVWSYTESFSSVLDSGVTASSIVATSISDDTVLIINESVSLLDATWSGQLLMTNVGDGIVEIRAEFSDSQILFDYFHVCTREETIVVC